MALEFAGAIKEDPGVPVDVVAATGSHRGLHWALAGLVALVVAGLEVGIIYYLGEDTVAAEPSAAVKAVYDADPCAQRMALVTAALAAYIEKTGEAPLSLWQMRPGYLAVPPVDPLSGKPYEYIRDGSGAAVSCPDPDHHPVAGG